MTEIKFTNYHDVVFSRNSKLDDYTKDIVAYTIFKKYDTNQDRSFDDAEWALYEKALQKRIEAEKNSSAKENVVEYYDDKLQKISKEIQKINEKWNTLDWSILEKLEEFEKKYPEISRGATNKKSDIPKGATRFNAQAWRIGVYNKEKDCFTGEISKYGYVIGLEKLTKKERKEYLKLLKQAEKVMNESEKYTKQVEKLDAKYDYYVSLKDMAKSGMVSKVGSREYEDRAYNQYVNIRNEANPFYKEIKNLEQKRLELWLKGTRTPQDNNLINLYDIQIEHLQKASLQWSIGELSSNQKVSAEGFSITDWSENVTYSSTNYEDDLQSNKDSQELTDTHSFGVAYSNTNLDLSAYLQKAEKYSFKPEKEIDNIFEASFMAGYKREDFSISSSSSFSANENMLMFNQSLGVKYKDFKLKVTETIESMLASAQKEQAGDTASKTTFATTANLEHLIGNFTNNASVTFKQKNINASVGTCAMFSNSFGKGFSYNINPGLRTEYSHYEESESVNINPSLSLGLNYNAQNDFYVGLNVSENYSVLAPFGGNSNSSEQMNKRDLDKIELIHDLTATARMSYKKFLTGVLKFQDSDSSFDHSNTYGAEFSYSTPKAGTFTLDYSYKKTKSKQIGCSDKGCNQITFRYAVPLDWTRKKNKH